MRIGHYANQTKKATFLEIGGVTLYFSYTTIVAVTILSITYVIQNQRGSTTGKHLNAIDGGNKKDRLAPQEFKTYVQLAEKKIGEFYFSLYISGNTEL